MRGEWDRAGQGAERHAVAEGHAMSWDAMGAYFECDRPACGRTFEAGYESFRMAQHRAKVAGWRRRIMHVQWVSWKVAQDFCPDHAGP